MSRKVMRSPLPNRINELLLRLVPSPERSPICLKMANACQEILILLC
nr:hypothetical protein [Dendronalium sp. ChiSLP03b]MDZ8207042.1 hypothetical protein [Dendronalium sp. ChiSLP03b]